MSISATSCTSGSNAADWQSSLQQARNDFRTLAQALQTGDLTGAQQAFAVLQKDLPNQNATGQTGAGSQDSPLAKLDQALKSGDLAGAQQALAAMRGARHGHHHHHAAASESASSPVKSSSTVGDNGIDQTGSVLNASA